MSKRITWSHQLRVDLYKALLVTLGHPDDVPRGARGKPIGMSKAEYISKLDDIGVLIGEGKGKGGALSNQIAWVTCIPSKRCHQGHWNNRKKNQDAAQEAGYLNQTIKPVLKSNGNIDVPASVVSDSNINEAFGTSNIFKRAWTEVKSWFS